MSLNVVHTQVVRCTEAFQPTPALTFKDPEQISALLELMELVEHHQNVMLVESVHEDS